MIRRDYPALDLIKHLLLNYPTFLWNNTSRVGAGKMKQSVRTLMSLFALWWKHGATLLSDQHPALGFSPLDSLRYLPRMWFYAPLSPVAMILCNRYLFHPFKLLRLEQPCEINPSNREKTFKENDGENSEDNISAAWTNRQTHQRKTEFHEDVDSIKGRNWRWRRKGDKCVGNTVRIICRGSTERCPSRQ